MARSRWSIVDLFLEVLGSNPVQCFFFLVSLSRVWATKPGARWPFDGASAGLFEVLDQSKCLGTNINNSHFIEYGPLGRSKNYLKVQRFFQAVCTVLLLTSPSKANTTGAIWCWFFEWRFLYFTLHPYYSWTCFSRRLHFFVFTNEKNYPVSTFTCLWSF